ncbi:hypothetical protein [Pontiella desulfatans]|uniref:hypothetical protein n=1 Tax=Pontiella desulfatans TaxID=2750659 RepID=UPI0014442878|nr:hypothetical protein [Pontiella desulfatans]
MRVGHVPGMAGVRKAHAQSPSADLDHNLSEGGGWHLVLVYVDTFVKQDGL